MKLRGTTLTYEHETGGAYRLRFAANTVAWEYLAGTGAGDSGISPYDAAEVGRDALFITWSEPNGEAVSLVANLERETVYVNYIYGSERHFLRAKITGWTALNAVDP